MVSFSCSVVLLVLVFVSRVDAKVVKLWQSDFDDGTFIADQENTQYMIMEDIVFAPNSDNGYMPYTGDDDCGKYCGKEFVLGFFSVMAINAQNVEVNLNGFEIKGSEEFLLHQRFYSIIQLGKAPFIPTQGPANFGDWTSQTTNVKIYNGTLGLSSHHGIHGHNAVNVEIHDLVIKDFEVAGIHINGAKNVEIRDVIIEDVLDNIYYDSSISHGLFVVHLLDQLEDAVLDRAFLDTTVRDIRDDLQEELEQVLDHGLSEGYDGFFAKQTKKGRPDGSFAAGIVIRGDMNAGGAIGPFEGTIDGKKENKKGENVRLENININNIVLEPVEWISLNIDNVAGGVYGGTAGTIKGPFGDVIDPRTWKNNFAPTVLSAAQFAACELAKDGIVSVAKTCSDNTVLENYFSGAETLEEVLNKHTHSWNCNKDLMKHHMKGVVGMRIEDLKDVTLKDITINNVQNYGKISEDHNAKCADEKFRGADAFGIVFGNIGRVITEGEVAMIDIISKSGDAASVALNGKVDEFTFAGDHNNWYTDDISSDTLATEFYKCPATGIQFVTISWDQEYGSTTSCPFNTCDAIENEECFQEWDELYWNKTISDIDGEAADDRSGYAVSLSGNGDFIAVGAPYNDEGGEDAGHVRVYNISNNEIKQLGQDIDGVAAGDWFGYSVSMNEDGARVAIGARNHDNSIGTVQVYEYTNENEGWTQVHLDIDGEAVNDRSGESVSISADGTRVAIGALTNDNNGGENAGHVRIYEERTTGWVKLGSDLDGECAEDRAGVSTALSGNGARVAIGAGNSDNDGGENAGHIRVYEYDADTEDWIKIGQNINGEEAEDRSGRVVSLNWDGSIVAIGAPQNDVEGAMSNAGHVRIYKYSSSLNDWYQLGSDIDGAYTDDRFGLAVAINYAGDRIVIGGRYNDASSTLDGEDHGHIQVYHYSEIDGDWIKIGEDMTGEAADDKFGFFVSMSADGMRVAAGARGNDENGVGAGHVRVFDLAYDDGNRRLLYSGKDIIFTKPASQRLLLSNKNDYQQERGMEERRSLSNKKNYQKDYQKGRVTEERRKQ